MPLVQITWVAGRTAEQKRRIAERITAVFVEEAQAARESVHIAFVETPATDIAHGGVPVADRKPS